VAGNLVHFEFPADDSGRSTAFWGSLFGWDFAEHQAGSGYHMTQTPQPGGAVQDRQEGQSGITVYFDTDDVDATAAKVESLGGSVVMPKTPVPSMGYFAICQDTEGNAFGIWESDESAPAPS
jgi:predicted enzyme related to lactoylglutathione lyase